MYSISTDEENYRGQFETLAAALAEAKEEGLRFVWVGECRAPFDPVDGFSADLWLEHVAVQDDYNVEAAIDWYADALHEKQAVEELERDVRKVMADWLDKHGLRPTHFLIENAVKYDLETGKPMEIQK